MAVNVATKHIIAEIDNELEYGEYYVAETIEQAMEIQQKLIGENPGKAENWHQCPDNDGFLIRIDDAGEIAKRYCGVEVYGECGVWAEVFDIGFLCGME